MAAMTEDEARRELLAAGAARVTFRLCDAKTLNGVGVEISGKRNAGCWRGDKDKVPANVVANLKAWIENARPR